MWTIVDAYGVSSYHRWLAIVNDYVPFERNLLYFEGIWSKNQIQLQYFIPKQ